MRFDFKKAVHVTASAGAILASLAMPIHAADHWLSGVTIQSSSGGTFNLKAGEFALESLTLGDSSDAVFDITISLEEDPQGDDDYKADGGTTDAEQKVFEAKIEEFARAVFQSTNGAHKIGKVTMFRKGEQSTIADVRWDKDCAADNGPYAYPSTFGVAGGYIHMCTTWANAPTSMNTTAGGGHTLAHEWGHYAYGLYDEYAEQQCGVIRRTFGLCGPRPRADDTVAIPSIMNNQWRAATDRDYLEFSTSNIAPYNSILGSNAHKRVFGESNWDTLVRDPKTDPKHSYLPTRTRYTTLTAPTSPNFIVNDNESTALSALDIIWAGDQVVELMIDDSGSMGGTPIANAITAGSLLVGQLTPGQTAVGVGRFDSSASQAYPITDIPDPDTGVRAAAQAAIAALRAGGGTNIEGAALTALNQTQSFQGGTRPSVVYLLTDGRSSVNRSTVINAYKAASVPLITFGFGSNVDTGLLTALADGTGGRFFNSPTTLAEIQQAFIAANAAFSSTVLVASSASSAAASSTTTQSIPLDSTLATSNVTVTYAAPESDISLALLDPSGTATSVMFNCEGTSEVSCTGEVDVSAIGAGDYTLNITNNTGTAKDVDTLIAGSPTGASPYDVAVEFSNVNYPDAFSIFATVTQGPSIAGLDVVAEVTKPDNTVVSVPLLDDGVGSDLVADDGTYTADVAYDQNGIYNSVVTASNAAGNATTTFEGIAVALAENGEGIVPTPRNISENFTRTGAATAVASNVLADDHTNDPTAPALCSAVADDNIDVTGRIDAAGDVDCFFFTPSSTTSDLIARVTSLAAGMDPVVTVFDATGTTQLAQFTLSSSANSQSGAVATVPASALNAAGHVVTIAHSDATADMGTYALSVGPVLASDVAEAADGGGTTPPADPATPTDTGGALGPWSVLFGALLALVGLRQRRRMS